MVCFLSSERSPGVQTYLLGFIYLLVVPAGLQFRAITDAAAVPACARLHVGRRFHSSWVDGYLGVQRLVVPDVYLLRKLLNCFPYAPAGQGWGLRVLHILATLLGLAVLIIVFLMGICSISWWC